MNKRDYVTLVVCTLAFSGVLYYMGEQEPKVNHQIGDIAKNSYFLGCVKSLVKKDFAPEEFIDMCEQDSLDFKKEIDYIMQSEN